MYRSLETSIAAALRRGGDQSRTLPQGRCPFWPSGYLRPGRDKPRLPRGKIARGPLVNDLGPRIEVKRPVPLLFYQCTFTQVILDVPRP